MVTIYGGSLADNITDELTGGSGSDTFVYEWRENLGNGVWVPKDSENVNDFASGDTLEWKELPL